jgi:hypothetical protein
MSNGDDIEVTIQDTVTGDGTIAFVEDNTSGMIGSMTAGSTSGFFHNVNTTDCTTEPFTFHPLYATASSTHVWNWAALKLNVAFAMEIGHYELCGNASCSTKPDGNDEGACSVTTTQTCAKNTDCPTGETCVGNCAVTTSRGIGGCQNQDLDRDGVSYQAKWADGSSAHPAPIILGSVNNKGVGPMSVSANNSAIFSQGYDTLVFQTTESTAATFYPFFSQAGVGASCRFNFGNDIPGTTKTDFSKAAQYTGVARANPCFPDTSWLTALSLLR